MSDADPTGVRREDLRVGDRVAWISTGSRGNLRHHAGVILSLSPLLAEIATAADGQSCRCDVEYRRLRLVPRDEQ